MKIPLKLRQLANALATRVFPNRHASWTSPDHIDRLRADVRDAYLAGWADGVNDTKTATNALPDSPKLDATIADAARARAEREHAEIKAEDDKLEEGRAARDKRNADAIAAMHRKGDDDAET